jgi:hypothetical protein
MFIKQELFGQVALRRGFVSSDQLQQAQESQRHHPVGTPRLLGLIMLDHGMISTAQMIEVLREVRQITTARWVKKNGRMIRFPHREAS